MKITPIAIFLIMLSSMLQAQTKGSFELKAAYQTPKKTEDLKMEFFQGIEKLHFSLERSSLLKGKDYKIIIREFQEGQLKTEKVVLDTELEGLPKIDSTFQFTLFAQNLLNYEKIAFFFPRFHNKQIFETKETFKDGDFSLRKINFNEDHLNFKLEEPFQIALITPPNRDPSKGNLGYCEVSQGGIEIDEWYQKYRIPQFFLIYLEIG